MCLYAQNCCIIPSLVQCHNKTLVTFLKMIYGCGQPEGNTPNKNHDLLLPYLPIENLAIENLAIENLAIFNISQPWACGDIRLFDKWGLCVKHNMVVSSSCSSKFGLYHSKINITPMLHDSCHRTETTN